MATTATGKGRRSDLGGVPWTDDRSASAARIGSAGVGSKEAEMPFRGWPVEALEFFEALEAENTRSFWEANRGVYEATVRAPMEALLEELEPEWGEGR
ncbi:MAG TPA: DUF2461 family protein, partial [Actinomycetota bacterium]|nr:DUF2461 family protein [Actinomycetota bacterium]